jgi:hypothetical protein
MTSTMPQSFPAVQYPSRKPQGIARHFTSVLPIPEVRDRIVRDFERGVCLASLCIMYERTSKAVQEILRDRLRELEAMMRHAAARYDDDQASIQRNFRTRRGSRRRRGLEDELAEVTDHARAECRIEAPGLGIGRAA